MKKFWLGFAVLAMSVASAADSYHVTLYEPSTIAGKQLKAGDYKIEIKDNKAVIKAGKEIVEAPVKVENSDSKFSTTTVRYNNAEGKNQVQEIRFGNTKTKLVFGEASQAGL